MLYIFWNRLLRCHGSSLQQYDQQRQTISGYLKIPKHFKCIKDLTEEHLQLHPAGCWQNDRWVLCMSE